MRVFSVLHARSLLLYDGLQAGQSDSEAHNYHPYVELMMTGD
jgi:hypothetical protein